MINRKEYYFCLHLTENEHDCVHDDILEKCKEFDLELKYYRILKDGHWPMYREVKVVGNLGPFIKWVEDTKLTTYIVRNPYKLEAGQKEPFYIYEDN